MLACHKICIVSYLLFVSNKVSRYTPLAGNDPLLSLRLTISFFAASTVDTYISEQSSSLYQSAHMLLPEVVRVAFEFAYSVVVYVVQSARMQCLCLQVKWEVTLSASAIVLHCQSHEDGIPIEGAVL